jgi:hypothetical protein
MSERASPSCRGAENGGSFKKMAELPKDEPPISEEGINISLNCGQFFVTDYSPYRIFESS